MTELVTLPRLVGCGLCGVGLYVLAQLLLSIRKVREIETWQGTTGKIVESEVCGGWARVGTGRSTWIEKPKIAYRYVVNGREYIGHDIAPTEIDTSSKLDAVKKIEPYPVGKEVTVYYDPSTPQDSVLQKKASPVAFAAFGLIGVVMLSVGLLILVGVIQV